MYSISGVVNNIASLWHSPTVFLPGKRPYCRHWCAAPGLGIIVKHSKFERKSLLPMNDQFDVAILGAGFEGGMLGTILAYSGAKVVIIDAGTHPRFALGESTVRHTFRMIKIMAERFGVPEFKTEFNSGELLHKHVSNHFGVKKNFGFVYHRPGEHQRPAEANQLVIPPYRE